MCLICIGRNNRNAWEENKKIEEMKRWSKKSREIADKILFDLAEKEITCEEAIEIIKMVDERIRIGRSILFEKVNKTSLKETLKEVIDHDSLTGKLPDV